MMHDMPAPLPTLALRNLTKATVNHDFWETLDRLTAGLGTYDPTAARIPTELRQTCQDLCRLLKAPEAQRFCADPRYIGRMNMIRARYADTWSILNSRLEFEIAEELWDAAETYEDFLTLTAKEPLFWNTQDVVENEMALLAKHGISVNGLRVCMIGPGALPHTALALAHAGAHVTTLDCYGPACSWVENWFGKFFEAGSYCVIEDYAQNQSFEAYDVVIVAAMLFGRDEVMAAIEKSQPRHVLVRTSANRRPMSILMPQANEDDLRAFAGAAYMDETNPPLKVGNYSLLFDY